MAEIPTLQLLAILWGVVATLYYGFVPTDDVPVTLMRSGEFTSSLQTIFEHMTTQSVANRKAHDLIVDVDLHSSWRTGAECFSNWTLATSSPLFNTGLKLPGTCLVTQRYKCKPSKADEYVVSNEVITGPLNSIRITETYTLTQKTVNGKARTQLDEKVNLFGPRVLIFAAAEVFDQAHKQMFENFKTLFNK